MSKQEFGIKKFVIKKLFNKYDVTLDFKGDCLILIGPNGVGKTSALKILNCYLEGQFIDIIAIPFQEIQIYFNPFIEDYLYNNFTNYEENIIITYDEFLPSIDYLVKKYENQLKYDENLYEQEIDYNEISNRGLKDITDKTLDLKKTLKELKENNLIGSFLYNLYKGNSQTKKIEEIVKKRVDYNSIKKSKWVSYKYGIPYRAFGGSSCSEYYLKFYDNITYKNILLGEKNHLFLNLVENYSIDNSRVDRSNFYEKKLEWLTNIEGEKKSSIIRDMMDCDLDMQNFGISNLIKRYLNLNVVDIYKEYLSEEKHIEEKINIQATSSNYLFFEKELKINSLIYNNYYKGNIVDIVQKKADKYSMKYLNKENFNFTEEYKILTEKNKEKADINMMEFLKTEWDTLASYYTPEIVNDYYDYIKPILINNSLFYTDILYVFNEHYSEYKDETSTYHDSIPQFSKRVSFLSYMKDFLKEVIPFVKSENAKSKETLKIQTMIKKYMNDKYIEVTPSRLKIRESNLNGRNGLFVLYTKDEIDLSILSSGEKKILLLFAAAIYFENTVFLIDEPELSLSLVWQESLLGDLLSCGNDNKYIVATHSPYIAKDEKLAKFITFLPQKEEK